MAHWIIEKQHNEEKVYQCSYCGDTYVGSFHDIDSWTSCPNCKRYIDREEDYYVKSNEESFESKPIYIVFKIMSHELGGNSATLIFANSDKELCTDVVKKLSQTIPPKDPYGTRYGWVMANLIEDLYEIDEIVEKFKERE